MRRIDLILSCMFVGAWLAFFACFTWLEWVRPKAPDPAHGFTHYLKGFQTIVYVTPTDIALRDGVSAVAGVVTVAVILLGAWSRR